MLLAMLAAPPKLPKSVMEPSLSHITACVAVVLLMATGGRPVVEHNPDAPTIENLDALPHVVDVYRRDLTVEDYYIGYLLHPYVSLYTGRGCPARCTFCLWPQTIGGHTYRTRSPQNVLEEMEKAKAYFPQVKEFFFDDDTFTANVTRARDIALGLKKLGITWSCNSRARSQFWQPLSRCSVFTASWRTA